MYFSKSLIVTALLGFAAAKKHSNETISASETLMSTASGVASAAASSSTPSTSGTLVTHTIQVGGPNGSLTFSPNNIQANAGDMVQFQFHPKNHSVVQSTFDNPCIPIQNIMSNKTNAFFSGFMPTTTPANSTSKLLTYTIRVPDTKPIWFYCSQAKHCQSGMVGAINAPTSGAKTMAAFAALAAQAAQNLSPGQTSSSGSGSSSGSSSDSSAGSSNSTSGTSDSSGTATSGAASGTSSGPAQSTANAAAGLMLGGQSVVGIGAAMVAALALL